MARNQKANGHDEVLAQVHEEAQDHIDSAWRDLTQSLQLLPIDQKKAHAKLTLEIDLFADSKGVSVCVGRKLTKPKITGQVMHCHWEGNQLAFSLGDEGGEGVGAEA
jgi:hypothetical protein